MGVRAMYHGRLYVVADNLNDCELVGGPTVEFGDPDLTVDPADGEVAEAENLGEFYGVEGAALERLRRDLRGE